MKLNSIISFVSDSNGFDSITLGMEIFVANIDVRFCKGFVQVMLEHNFLIVSLYTNIN